MCVPRQVGVEELQCPPKRPSSPEQRGRVAELPRLRVAPPLPELLRLRAQIEMHAYAKVHISPGDLGDLADLGAVDVPEV